MKALIIAAGNGNRLRKFDSDHPKPLFKVAGLSLIDRTILSAKKAGITEFVVVVGFRGDEIRRHFERRAKKMGVTVTCVENAEWEKPNGHSVLKARPHLEGDFVLLMSDHVFDWRILQDLLQTKPGEGEILLATDDRVREIFDLEDATKVQTKGDQIVSIGKSLPLFDTIDTGIFYCTPALFSALEEVCSHGGGSLSEAISRLASEGRARVFRIGRIGNRFWQDVDTPASLKEAEQKLFLSVKKETDGVVSRTFNRKVSGFITRFLVRTPLTANQVTWSALMVGLLSGFLISRGTYWDVALGGILFQFASIYDGCDGEMAKLKFSSSKFGEWLDTICDNITYLAFFVGVLVGAYRQGFEYILPVGIMTLFGVAMALGTSYLYLVKFTNSGSIVTVLKDLARDVEVHEHNGFIRGLMKIGFMAKRDFFALFFMVLCLFNRLDWILILAAIGSNIGWLMLITLKREFAAGKAPSLQEE